MSRPFRLLTAAAFIFAALSCAKADPLGSTLDEKMILLAPGGVDRADRDIAQAQSRLRAQPDLEHFERLGWTFIAKARRTLDAGYYKLAEKVADAMDARFGSSPSSLLLRGHVLDNLHHFKAAENVARRLVASRGDAYDWALLSDALMEQGQLAPAVAACQEEMNRRPGLESYARAAHLRWLTGDLAGATAMMNAAVRCSSPVDPANCAWVVTRLSGYMLQAGDAGRALRLAQGAAQVAPGYPPALLAEGRALLALGRVPEAAQTLAEAARLNPLPEYLWWSADALRAAGRRADADQAERDLLATGETDDPRTFALFAATRVVQSRGGNASLAAAAVRSARAELGNRADPLTEDALAWALAAAGDWPGAGAAMAAARRAGTRDARLLLHAGVIARSRGDLAAARSDFGAAAACAATLTPGESALLRQNLLSPAVASADPQ